MRKTIEITPNLEALFGTRDENLHLMEDGLRLQIDLRSDGVHLDGTPESIARAERIFADYESLRKAGMGLGGTELHGMLRMVVADPNTTLKSLVESGNKRSTPGVKRVVQPRSLNQRSYVEAIEKNDMTFGIGPAGTGKTYLAVAMAVSQLLAKKVSRIILVRPAVEAGERLGFLPGTAGLKTAMWSAITWCSASSVPTIRTSAARVSCRCSRGRRFPVPRGRVLLQLLSRWSFGKTA